MEQIARVLDVNESWLTGQDVPMTKYDGTPEAFDTAKLSDDKNRRSKVVDILYNQMEILSKAYKDTPDDLIDLINLSVAMAEIAKAISYLQ